MKDYLMLNKIRMTYNLIKIRIYDFFHPDMSYTINSNMYINENVYDNYWFPSKLESHEKKTFIIPIGDLNKKHQERLLADLISEYKSEIEFDETDGEIYFISNKKEDLN